MPKLKNVNPLGYVDVPLIGRVGPAPYLAPCDSCAVEHDPDHEHAELIVEPGADEAGVGCLIPGEVFEVSAEHAAILLDQVENYELVKASAKNKTEEV